MHTLEEGQKFERYLIVRSSGIGGAGSSYEAEDSRQQRRVFLKIIHPWTLLPDAARRQFFREMQAVGSLAHPQLAPVFNYGEWHGQLFVARAYTRYGSLINEQGRTWFCPPLDTQRAITYATQIANALTPLHSIGYAHGSLTLSNILINQDPSTTIDSPFLIADAALGTFVRKMGRPPSTFLPMTTAPEQYTGRTIQASDQYALAVLIYLWLAGRPPFLGTPEEIRTHKSQGTIPSLLPFNANVTYGLENIIRRALSANPGHRFASINAFVQTLQKALDAALPPARPFNQRSDALARAEQKPAPQKEEPKKATTDTEPRQPAPEQGAINEPYLVITPPLTREQVIYPLTRLKTSLGHAGSSDILLDQDEETSRHHALIRVLDRQSWIQDRSSDKGVFVNGQKLIPEQEHALTDGDEITIGKYSLIFYYRQPAPPPLPKFASALER